MANIQERRDKNGVLISYSIRVHRGRDSKGNQLKPYTATFEVSPTWTEKSARRKAEAYAAVFEKECREGRACDTRQRFSDYCDYVIKMKETFGVKHKTIMSYKDLVKRIYPEIGHIKLKDLRVDMLNNLYAKLLSTPVKTSEKYNSIIDLNRMCAEKKTTRVQIAKETGLAVNTVSVALAGTNVSRRSAEIISSYFDIPLSKAFKAVGKGGTLSHKTVLEYHRLIHTVLDQALKEGLIPFNPADRVILPKVERQDICYFQPEQINDILEALETEPIKWRALIHLLIITGARRGEILGLKWSRVNLDTGRVNICNNVLYSTEKGIYEDSPKTSTSKRIIMLPHESIELLKEYKKWQDEQLAYLGDFCDYQDFIFCQPNGKPLFPDSVNDWLTKFSERHGLPHINPHAFRHTMASMLYFNNVDSVSISHMLGHSKISTTTDIYAHIINEAQQKNADVVASIYFGNKN